MAQPRFLLATFWAMDHRTMVARSAGIMEALKNVNDWLRFNPYTYLIWTDKSPSELYELLRRHITPDDQVIVAGVDLLRERYGWSQQWIWEWIDKHR